MPRTSLLLVLMLGLGPSGCNQGGGAAEDAVAGGGTAAEEPPAGETQAGRDLSAADVCALVPAQAVATAMGEQPTAAPVHYDPGFEGTGCRYKSGRRYAEISLLPPAHFEFMRRMTPKERVHPVSDLGNAAYWEDHTGRMELYVLRSGDATLWIRFQDRGKATQVDEARRLGEAVLASLR
jgi:hypothetical protein